MMLMAGSTRFFEELLRDDEPAVFPTISNWMTIAQWVAIGIMALGFSLVYVFSRRKSAKSTLLTR
jgi:prolipoprotein diacylglyceryltransferase